MPRGSVAGAPYETDPTHLLSRDAHRRHILVCGGRVAVTHGAAAEPKKLSQLLTLWEAYVKKIGVVVLDNFGVPLDNYLIHSDWLPPSLRAAAAGSQP